MDVEIEGAVVEEHLRRNRTPNRGKHQQPRSESAVHIGSVRDVAVEFVAGCVSGCAGIIVGQVRRRDEATDSLFFCTVTYSLIGGEM